jgi:hypothetical protein
MPKLTASINQQKHRLPEQHPPRQHSHTPHPSINQNHTDHQSDAFRSSNNQKTDRLSNTDPDNTHHRPTKKPEQHWSNTFRPSTHQKQRLHRVPEQHPHPPGDSHLKRASTGHQIDLTAHQSIPLVLSSRCCLGGALSAGQGSQTDSRSIYLTHAAAAVHPCLSRATLTGSEN